MDERSVAAAIHADAVPAVANLHDFRIEPGYSGPATVAEQICAAAFS
jgi:hypothetical protein